MNLEEFDRLFPPRHPSPQWEAEMKRRPAGFMYWGPYDLFGTWGMAQSRTMTHGEVAALECLPVAEAAALAATPEMTVDASLVTLDFLLRRRLLPAPWASEERALAQALERTLAPAANPADPRESP